MLYLKALIKSKPRIDLKDLVKPHPGQEIWNIFLKRHSTLNFPVTIIKINKVPESKIIKLIIKNLNLKPDKCIIVKTAIKYIIIVDNDCKYINSIAGMNDKVRPSNNDFLLL